jgi:hypothetical protein
MSREMSVLGVVGLVGGMAWIVMAWPVPKEDEAAVVLDSEPNAVVEPRPSMAAKLAEPAPAPEGIDDEELAEPFDDEEPEPVAEPQAKQPPHVRTTPDGRQEIDEFMKGDQGPVAEYRALYESEPRDFAAAEVEATLRTAFLEPRGGKDLVRSISCRETICKLELRWSMQRRRTYMEGVRLSLPNFRQPLAMSPVGPPDGNGVRTVELYMKRKPPSAAGDRRPSHD